MFSSIFQSTSERTDFIIALVVVVLFGIFIGNYIIENDEADNPTLENILSTSIQAPTSTEAQPVSSPPIEASRTYIPSNQPAEETDLLANTSIIYPMDSSAMDITAPTTASETTKTESDSDSIASQKIDKDAAVDIEQESATTLVDTVMSNPIDKSIIAPKAIEDNVAKDCRIIVGSYRLKSSMNDMLEMLQSTDYETINYREKGLNIVAVRHSCDKEALRNSVEHIRKQFAKGAFVTRK